MKQYFIKRLLAVLCALAFSANAGADSGNEGKEVCRAVQRFSVDVAERMRSGIGADREFDLHGGLDALSKPMLNIINYVHSHRVNGTIPPARIGALTLAKCENGSFGGLSYADLPEKYDPGYRKGEDGETAGNGGLPAVTPGLQQGFGRENRNVDSGNGRPDPHCEMYRQKIKEIDDRMRDGYTSEAGNSIREERRRYRQLVNEHCS